MELTCIAVGYTATLEKQLAAIPLLGIYPREIKVYVHKINYQNVHGRFIDNSLKLEVAQILINRKTTQQCKKKLLIHVNLKNIDIFICIIREPNDVCDLNVHLAMNIEFVLESITLCSLVLAGLLTPLLQYWLTFVSHFFFLQSV